MESHISTVMCNTTVDTILSRFLFVCQENEGTIKPYTLQIH